MFLLWDNTNKKMAFTLVRLTRSKNHLVKVSSLTKTDIFTKATGKMACNMAGERLKTIQVFMKDCGNKVKRLREH